LTHGIRLFREKCVVGITADRAANENNVMRSMAMATALVPLLGYHKVSTLARQSVTSGRDLIDILEQSEVLSRAEARALIEASVTPAF
jgi:aspartate ammonia-lyase